MPTADITLSTVMTELGLVFSQIFFRKIAPDLYLTLAVRITLELDLLMRRTARIASAKTVIARNADSDYPNAALRVTSLML